MSRSCIQPANNRLAIRDVCHLYKRVSSLNSRAANVDANLLCIFYCYAIEKATIHQTLPQITRRKQHPTIILYVTNQ